VGHTTLISGKGPQRAVVVRTGVTAVLPRGKDSNDPVFAGWDPKGKALRRRSPHRWRFPLGAALLLRLHVYSWSLPIVAETWDGYLNDINDAAPTRAHHTRLEVRQWH
jgi:D-aminopeptidase